MSGHEERDEQRRAGGAPSPPIETEEVRRIAGLARLALSDAEIEWFRVRLGAILEYVAKLDEVDTEGIEPTSHVVALANVLRDDAVLPSLSRDMAIGNAPASAEGFIVAPRIIESEDSERA